MKLLTWDEILKKLYLDKEIENYDPYNVSYEDLFKYMETKLNQESEDGWNLVTFIDDKIIPEQFGFLFKESERVYKYSIVFLDELMEKASQKWMQDGLEWNNENIAKILEGAVTPMYIPSLRYLVDDDHGIVLPIYIFKEETDIDEIEDKAEIYEKYQLEFKKNAIWQGKETKAFIEWEKSQS